MPSYSYAAIKWRYDQKKKYCSVLKKQLTEMSAKVKTHEKVKSDNLKLKEQLARHEKSMALITKHVVAATGAPLADKKKTKANHDDQYTSPILKKGVCAFGNASPWPIATGYIPSSQRSDP